MNSAITIQSSWRGFIVFSSYLIKRYENKAASTIQAHWRGYLQRTSYSIVQEDVSAISLLFLSQHTLLSHACRVLTCHPKGCENPSMCKGPPGTVMVFLPERVCGYHSICMQTFLGQKGMSQ